MQNVYEQVDINKRKSALVVVLFSLFIVVSTYLISRGLGAYYGYDASGFGLTGIALIVSGLTSFGGYWFSDKIVLGISGARLANRKNNFLFYTVAENMSLAAHVPMPKLYVIEDTAPNAFATGRDPEHAAICATTGILSKLNRTELEGVIAHEMSHVQNYDTRLMSVVAVLVGLVVLLGDWFFRATWWGRGSRDNREDRDAGAIFIVVGLIFAILSPVIAQLIQLAISRRRELLADASAVKLTRQPEGLLNALVKISGDREPLEAANKATAHLYIVNPFKGIHGTRDWFAGLFNTHPPLSERVVQLRSMM